MLIIDLVDSCRTMSCFKYSIGSEYAYNAFRKPIDHIVGQVLIAVSRINLKHSMKNEIFDILTE